MFIPGIFRRQICRKTEALSRRRRPARLFQIEPLENRIPLSAGLDTGIAAVVLPLSQFPVPPSADFGLKPSVLSSFQNAGETIAGLVIRREDLFRVNLLESSGAEVAATPAALTDSETFQPIASSIQSGSNLETASISPVVANGFSDASATLTLLDPYGENTGPPDGSYELMDLAQLGVQLPSLRSPALSDTSIRRQFRTASSSGQLPVCQLYLPGNRSHLPGNCRTFWIMGVLSSAQWSRIRETSLMSASCP